MKNDPARVVLSLDEIGRGPISLNGMDLGKYVRATEILARVGEPTVVRLELVNVTVDAPEGIQALIDAGAEK